MANKADLRSKIIKIIALHGAVTRPELISRLGVRAATLFEAVDELKRNGVIHEPERGGQHTGRRAPWLGFCPDRLWLVGVDFREKYTCGVIIDATGEVRAQARVDAVNRSTLAACRNEIRSVMLKLHDESGGKWHLVKGVALADPGLVDGNLGVSLKAVNVPGWENSKTRDWLEAEYSVRSLIVSGVVAECYAEYLLNIDDFAGRGVFYLSTGEGIGAGFIKNGYTFTGDSFQAMEIGHLVLQQGGPLCQCGNRGCLEALAGGNGIRRKIGEAVASGVDTVLALENFSFETFVNSVDSDKTARIIASEVCGYIGTALASVVTLLNPGVIVIGGRLTGLGDFMLNSIRQTLAMNCMPGALKQLDICFADPAEFKTARGAALMLRNEIMQMN